MNWCLFIFLLVPLYSFADKDIPVAVASFGPQELIISTGPQKVLRRFSNDEETNRLGESFRLWLSCHSARFNGLSLPEECLCEVPGTSASSIIPDYMFLMRTCQPDQIHQNIAYNPNLDDEQKIQRDDLICRCVQGRLTIDSFVELEPTQKDVKELSALIVSHAKKANLSPRQENAFQQRYGSALSLGNLSLTAEGKTRMIGVYTEDTGRGSRRNGMIGDYSGFLRRHLDPSPLSEDQCIPYTDFLLHKQFSLEPDFYATFPSSFKESDWDYRSLLKSLGPSSNLEEVMNNEENRAALARMKFLNDNPIYKNLFSSPGRGKNKERLFALLSKKYPKPKCEGNTCKRDSNFYNEVKTFRKEVFELFSDPDVERDVQRGIAKTSALAEESLVAEELMASNNPFSDRLRELPSDSQRWKTFCQLRDQNADKTVLPKHLNLSLLHGIEKKFGRSFLKPEEDTHYAKVNQEYCQEERKPFDGGRPMRFKDFKAAQCGSMDHRACLKSFVTAYPFPMKNDTFINDIYTQEGFSVPVLDRAQVERGIAIGSSHQLRQTSIRELANGNYNNDKSVETLTPTASTPLAGASPVRSDPRPSTTPTQETIQNSEVSNFVGPISAAVPIPPKPADIVKDQLRQVDSDAQEIKSEISELRDSLQREAVRPENPEQSDLIRSLNERMLSLEKRLETKEEEKRLLEEKLAEASKPASDGNRTLSGSIQETRERFSQAPRAESSNSQTEAVSNLPSSGLPANNPTSLGKETTGLSNTKVLSSVKNSSSLMRSKYADKIDQTGSITVSTSGADPQSAPDSISVPFSSDEFKKLSESALEKYFSGTDKPFVRVSLQDGEAFLVRKGISIEIIPVEEGVRRGIASLSTPEPEKVSDRTVTRDDLVRELNK